MLPLPHINYTYDFPYFVIHMNSNALLFSTFFTLLFTHTTLVISFADLYLQYVALIYSQTPMPASYRVAMYINSFSFWIACFLLLLPLSPPFLGASTSCLWRFQGSQEASFLVLSM